MSENEKNNEEYLSSVLSVTREQLTRSMNVCAELEALLVAERNITQQLKQALAEAQNAAAPKKDSKE